MQSTFTRDISSSEPRTQLAEGVTAYYIYIPPRRTQAQAPLPEIPDSACEFALKTLEFPADAPQQAILASASRRIAICCTRQWGKSTTAALKALHHALTNPASLVLIASRTRRQAGETLDKAIDFARILDIRIRRANRHPDSLLLPNHSRIIALPGKPDSLRGYSAVSLLIVDEAAYVLDELYHAVRDRKSVV